MLDILMAWVSNLAFLLSPFGFIALMILMFGGDAFWYLGDRRGWQGKFWIVVISLLILTAGLWVIMFGLWFILWVISLGVNFFHSWIEVFHSF